MTSKVVLAYSKHHLPTNHCVLPLFSVTFWTGIFERAGTLWKLCRCFSFLKSCWDRLGIHQYSSWVHFISIVLESVVKSYVRVISFFQQTYSPSAFGKTRWHQSLLLSNNYLCWLQSQRVFITLSFRHFTQPLWLQKSFIYAGLLGREGEELKNKCVEWEERHTDLERHWTRISKNL